MLRPVVKWHGGKFYLVPRILELIPPHHTYVEPFGGTATVLINKPPAPVEVYNDLDGRITRLFRVLRDHPQEFLRRLQLTPYSELEWQEATDPTDDDIERARRDFVRWRLSIGGRGEAFSYTLHRVRRGMADVVSGFLSAIDEVLPLIIERLRRVQILCRDAFEVIPKWDSPDTLFYCDPPYLPSVVTRSNVYGCTLSDRDHDRLLKLLCRCRGKVILSGYPNPLYDARLKKWRRLEVDIANHAAKGAQKRRCCEVLWCNW
ncbi:MAG: DNA adenine methylase [Thermoguttaceae bacterium]|nr:DNA adenine methylase [Thermoguttaceae bacterium]